MLSRVQFRVSLDTYRLPGGTEEDNDHILFRSPRQGSIDAGKGWDRSAPASHAATGVPQWLGTQSPGDLMLALSTQMN
jgi:hypothetical protein